ncbi:MAG TPA: hypothetical protein H9815_00545 [Candidatus Ruania gallistercoris]|uniref:Thiamine pyrophosphate enzyme TPP-binding domain-containing protein n=1 Tax=Candidatus Ruania gallistercoris TaxID=2838746 RepID=A0A9D2J3D3_9MICO|nr:hypothetical protein [Candidatus Ruania gallistercoris]
MSGSPKFLESQQLPDVDYAGFAESLGLGVRTVTRDSDVGEAWDFALAADGPVLLDVHSDPNFPPIPPSATLDQALKSAKSLIEGDPDRWGC